MIAISKPVRVMAPLAAAIAAYPLLPSGLVRDLGYQAIGLVAVIAAFWGLLRQGPARPRGWLLVLCGYLGWFIGDSVHTLGDRPLRRHRRATRVPPTLPSWRRPAWSRAACC